MVIGEGSFEPHVSLICYGFLQIPMIHTDHVEIFENQIISNYSDISSVPD